MKAINSPPCFYLFLYKKIKEKANGRKIISNFELLEITAKSIPQIPKKFRYIMIKEMERDYNLIRRIDKQKIQVTGGNIDAKLEKYSHPFL